MGNGVTVTNTASVNQQDVIDSLTEQLAKANERTDELLSRVGESEAKLVSVAITGSSAYLDDALNKFAIEQQIKALEDLSINPNNESEDRVCRIIDDRIEQLRNLIDSDKT